MSLKNGTLSKDQQLKKPKMNQETYSIFKDISKKHKEREVGKICQCILALTFIEIGYQPEKITVNLVEGVDLILEGDSKYAIEVKTTNKNKITVGEKDLGELSKYKENGYISVLCALKIDLGGEWKLINPERLKRKSTWKFNELYTDIEFKELEKNINEIFEKKVKANAIEIRDKGLSYLIGILKKEGIKHSGG